MSKGKKKKYSWYRPSRRMRRRSKGKIPLEVAGAGIAIPFCPPRDGWNSPIGCVQNGDWNGLAGDMAMGFTGINILGSEPINVMGMLNPFDLSYARYTKLLVWAGLASKIRKRLVHVPMEKVPILGRYLS